MIQTLQTRRAPRVLSLALTLVLCGPVLVTLAGCGNKGGDTGQAASTQTAPTDMTAPNAQTAPPAKQGMSTGKKAVIVLAGAALLYYLYKKHQAAQQQAGVQGNGATPQLYRSSNGGVYYRDPQNPQKVTWLTVPSQPMSVPANQVQQYAPDYQQYQGQPAPAVPAGQSSQSFSQYDPNAASQ